MSRLTELIRQAKEKDPALGAELEREYRVLSSRRAFGLNFERHRPEAVELPGRPVRRGDKVRVLPPRGSTERGDQRLWRVARIEKAGGRRLGHLEPLTGDDAEPLAVDAEDLVVVAEFRDPIHPGLIPTGSVHRGGDKPAHTVINGENFHVVKALTFTHRGKVDAIYIDPPYNTGAKDWKYNNDYVEGDDLYRHSKWLAFMERRLLLAKELLNPERSVLIVTIDEHEVHRLRSLLDQTFEQATIQMVTIVVNPKGVAQGRFARVEEYALYCFIGSAGVSTTEDDLLSDASTQRNTRFWKGLLRAGTNARPTDGLGMAYPIVVNESTTRIVRTGRTLRQRIDEGEVAGDPNEWVPSEASEPAGDGEAVVWPLRRDGSLGVWQAVPETLASLAKQGFVKCVLRPDGWAVSYVPSGVRQKIDSGEVSVTGSDPSSGVAVLQMQRDLARAKSVWKRASHDAGWHGSVLLRNVIPGRKFPFPKSLYSVEDALRFVVGDRPNAVVLDFFAGSGTTAHAVMRLNKQDGGRRQCISVTNNEVSADEQRRLREQGLRPGDPKWEALGICDYITKPRIEAAITGRTPDGEPIKGDYKFTDEFPMADGFEENAEFFTLTYESPVAIGHNKAFSRIAPLLWLRAGARGRRIDRLPVDGYEVADAYGLLVELDRAGEFVRAIEKAGDVAIAYVVTDDDRRFQSVVRRLPEGVEPVRLYEAYLSNFRFTGVEP
jgi:adenine-specific DNA-methyltransferase